MSKGVIKVSLLSANLNAAYNLGDGTLTVEVRVGEEKFRATAKGKSFQSAENALFDVHQNQSLDIYVYPQDNFNEDLVVFGQAKLDPLLEFPHTRNHITIHAAYKEKGVLKQQEAGRIEVQVVYVHKLDAVLQINVQSAELYRDTEAVGKMDPFVELKIEETTKKTTVKQEAGKSPVWNESFFFIVSDLNAKLSIVVQDEDVTSNDIVGSSDVELRQSEFLKVTTEWVERTAELLYKGKVAGRLSYSSRFTANLAKPS